MEIIPTITMKKRKILNQESEKKDIFDQIKEDALLYILDLDGIEKDKPNLCTYQRLSGSHELWVDFGPRNIGDVVDTTMAGATDVTLRKNLCPELTLLEIREIMDNKIYADESYRNEPSLYDFDGFVNFNSKKDLGSSFKQEYFLKSMLSKIKMYTYETDIKNLTYWKNYGIDGLLVDFSNYKEFKNAL